jgi:S1-C subfamily serine protease
MTTTMNPTASPTSARALAGRLTARALAARTLAAHTLAGCLALSLSGLAWADGKTAAWPSMVSLQTISPTLISPQAPQISYMSGTAFAVSSQGHLVTAYHAIRDQSEVKVFSAAYPAGILAQVVAQDPGNDLALLKVSAGTQPLKIAQSRSVPTGLEVYALGYPQPRLQGSELKITSGLINAMQGPGGAAGYLQFSAPVQRGNSGGPLLSPDGLVVGMVQARLGVLVGSASREIPQNVNFALQSQGISRFLAQHQVPSQEASLTLHDTRRPHEIFASAQSGIFAVQVVSPLAQAGKEPPVPDEMRAVLINLPKDEQARLYGAFKAGFTQFKVVGSEYVMVRTPKASDSAPAASAADITNFEVILSLSRPRGLQDGQNFKSMVLQAQLQCAQGAMLVTRQEYKDESFGNGKTIRALRRSSESTAQPRPIQSEALKEFFKTSVCQTSKT